MRRAIITGGQSGLGAACATRLRADGVEVFTFDVSPDADFTLDITDPAAVEAAVAQVGIADILINSAGIVGPNKPLWEIELVDWKNTFDVNVNGLFSVTKAVVPGMITFASLAEGPARWEERTLELLDEKSPDRVTARASVARSPFSIESSVEALLQVYGFTAPL